MTALVWSAVMLSACGAPPRVPDTVVMASGTDLESGNPLVTVHSLTRQIQRHALFVTLVRLDSMMLPVPYFARRWHFDASQRVLTMGLHAGLAWHDGTPTSASDVRFTLEAARDPEVGSPRAGELATLDSVRTPSDTTVVLYFAAPQPRLPNVLAELPLVPAHLLRTVPRTTWRAAPFATAPVGNGPFRFASREAGRRWRFVRNASFPADMGGPPALAGFVVAVVDEASTKFAGLVSGELDIAGVSPSMAHLVRDDPTLTLLTPPALLSNILAFNTTRAPFNDRRVREAIALSIDRTRLVQAAVAGYATPAGSAIPPGLPMSGAEPPRHDTAAADALLDAAGYRRSANGLRARNGTPLRVELLTVGSGDMAIEQLIQADLRTRGFDVTLRVAELTTFLSTVRAVEKQFDLAITGIPGDIGAGQLSALFASAQRGGALDYTGFHDSRLDAALQQARDATAEQQRAAWALVDSILIRESPVVWLYHARGVQGLSRRLSHVTMDLRGELVSVARWTRQ
ncbi:MAG: peptide ABC transporter substrate-binding protein [Gemmatimonadaceae bacterium]|nr:peptide ABC transporter substrate-binding protein [Gemmatimonadaceae bacterium]